MIFSKKKFICLALFSTLFLACGENPYRAIKQDLSDEEEEYVRRERELSSSANALSSSSYSQYNLCVKVFGEECCESCYADYGEYICIYCSESYQ